jgi:hypothetical protein
VVKERAAWCLAGQFAEAKRVCTQPLLDRRKSRKVRLGPADLLSATALGLDAFGDGRRYTDLV